MYEFWPQFIIFLCLIGIIVVVARRLPLVANFKENKSSILVNSEGILKSTKGTLAGRLIREIKNRFMLLGNKVKELIFSLIKKMKDKFLEIKKQSFRNVSKEELQETKKQIEKLVAQKPASVISSQKTKSTQSETRDLLNKALEAQKNNNLSKAEKVYIEIIKQDPKNIEAYSALGNLYLRQKNFSDAKESFKQILKLKPEDREAKFQLSKLK